MVYKNIRNILLIIAVTVWVAVFSIDNSLHLIACDVGQGDSILIQKNSTQILIDGGPDKSVLDCLGRHMPFWDRKIEFVILTHPQADHYGGLIDVLKQYKVDQFGEYNTVSSNQGYEVLKNLVGSQGVVTRHLSRGTSISTGMIYLDVVYPNDNTSSTNVNNDGVVTLLRYGTFKALFTADVENKVSDSLSSLPEIENLNYIKVNHHGSRNGLSQKLLTAVDPEMAVISLGQKNKYGHPHKQILDMLESMKIKVLRTDQMGDIEIIIDTLEYRILN